MGKFAVKIERVITIALILSMLKSVRTVEKS